MNLKKIYSIILILSLYNCASIDEMNKNILYLNGMEIDKAISMLEIGQPTNFIDLQNRKIYIWESIQNISVPIGGYNQGYGYGQDGSAVSVSTWNPNNTSTSMSFKCKITIYTTNKYKITNSLVEGDPAQCNVFDKQLEEVARHIIKGNNPVSEGYFENGQLKFRITYEDGKQDWLSEIYYENGQLQRKGNYKNGALDGPLETYYDNGQLKSKENFKDRQSEGLSERYDINGQLESEYCYNNDKKVGMSYCEE